DQVVRVVGIHGEPAASGVLVNREHMVPGLAAIARAEDAAFFLRSRESSGDTGVDRIGILGMNDVLADAPALREPHVLPRRARVGGLVDAVALHIAVADGTSFARAGPDGLGIAGRDRKRADRLRALLIEDRDPALAGVGRLPDAARRRARVVGVR